MMYHRSSFNAFSRILAASILFVLTPWVMAKNLSHDEAQRLQASGEIVPLEQVLAKARAQKPGRLLELELEKSHGQLIYEIEIIDKNGVVWEFEFDAVNGELLRMKQDD